MVDQRSPKPLVEVRFLPSLQIQRAGKTFVRGSTPPGPEHNNVSFHAHILCPLPVKRSPTLRSGHQSFRSFGARNPAPNARLKTIHPADLRPGHSGAGVTVYT